MKTPYADIINKLTLKLTYSFESTINNDEWITLYNYIDSNARLSKVKPFNLYSNVLNSSNNISEFTVCRDFLLIWLERETEGIEKETNKQRKIVRLLDDMHESNKDFLSIALVNKNVFISCLKVFLLSDDEFTKYEDNQEILKLLRYMTGLVALQVMKTNYIENLLEIFLISDVGTLLKSLSSVLVCVGAICEIDEKGELKIEKKQNKNRNN